MKTKNVVLGLTLTTLSTMAMAQIPSVPSTPAVPTVATTAPVQADTSKLAPVSDTLADNHLDKAVAASGKGDTKTATSELTTGISNLKNEVKHNPGSLKDKILSQAGGLEKLLPLIQGGTLGSGVLQKAAGLAKLGLLHQRVEGLLGGSGSLVSKAAALTSNIKGLGGAMSVLGAAGSGGQSLLTGALGGLSKLGQGGAVAAAAEPAVKGQIGNLLNFVKGAM